MTGGGERKFATVDRFVELCSRIGIDRTRAEDAGNDLRLRYGEEHRAYHNLDHIDAMLGWFKEAGGGNDAIELAIWYHDCIYEPLEKSNEQRSALHFREQMGNELPPDFAAAVERLILATDPSLSRSGEADEDLIVDIDLAILGSEAETYEAYRKAIREEYRCVPDEEFYAGRRIVLERILSRPIFVTARFATMEQTARQNVADESDQATK